MTPSIIMCDIGSRCIRAGHSGSEEPECIVPNVVAKIGVCNMSKQDMVCGEDAYKHGDVEIIHPFRDGIIKEENTLKLVLDYVFREKMKITDFSKKKILLADLSKSSDKMRSLLIEIMFNHLGFGFISMSPKPLLAMYSLSLSTGIVVDCGDSHTVITPVCYGRIMSPYIDYFGIAGNDITKRLVELLYENGYPLSSSCDIEEMREIKEKTCFVSANFTQDTKLAVETTTFVEQFILSNKKAIKLSRERFESTEILFTPSLVGKDFYGIHECIFQVIQKCGIDIRKDLYKNIVVCGGNSKLRGFSLRLRDELLKLYMIRILKLEVTSENIVNHKDKICVINSSRKLSDPVFTGGSYLADSMKDENTFWISRSEFEKQGFEHAFGRLGIS